MGPGEDIRWRHPTQILVLQMIIQLSRISNWKFSQPNTIFIIIWQMKGCMVHHLPIPIAYSLNGSLSFAILMLGTNTRERLSLFSPLKIRAEVIQNKYEIYRMIMLGNYASQIAYPVFKRCFSNHYIPRSKRKLRFNMDKIRVGILKNSPATKSIMRRLSDIALMNPTSGFDNKVVGGNAITRLI